MKRNVSVKISQGNFTWGVDFKEKQKGNEKEKKNIYILSTDIVEYKICIYSNSVSVILIIFLCSYSFFRCSG